MPVIVFHFINCCLDIKLYLVILSYANARRSDVVLAINFVKFKYYGYGVIVFYELLLMLKMFICTSLLLTHAVQCLLQCIFSNCQ